MRPGSIAPARGAVHVGTCSLPAALSEGPFLCRPRRRSLRGLELLTLNMFPSKELEFHHPRWDQGPGREVTYQSAWVLHPELKSSDSWEQQDLTSQFLSPCACLSRPTSTRSDFAIGPA
ncbi:small integral membrane protein 11A isoform X2 [Prionailurus bengalensis]|uniref:small integral membrane protein 11A isoform X2 n=1 Tax=Prionailurus bengalensis TaxID=37029 RepID=UPI001CA8F4FA|nr:small integral membrane protein 11A isoform X2 [Prionailurus bengalensis]XP_043449593.1 small integral membrane protein 11A isoform X2 [Prionailurus bengalensis]